MKSISIITLIIAAIGLSACGKTGSLETVKAQPQIDRPTTDAGMMPHRSK